MRKLFIVLLVALLAACSSAPTAAPTQPPAPTVAQPTNTPVVLVQTVVVEATQKPTDVPQPTPIPPTAVPPTAVVVTVVVPATADQSQAAQPTQAQPTQQQPAAASGGAVNIDNALGRGVFSNMTMSSSNLTLRCTPRDVTFNITTSNIDIKDALFYYRIVDLKRQYPSEWKNFGKMTANGNGNFTLDFKGENVDPNIRIDGSWLDFQFVGLNKNGDVVDRSDKITELLKYTFDCP